MWTLENNSCIIHILKFSTFESLPCGILWLYSFCETIMEHGEPCEFVHPENYVKNEVKL